jgi:predicted transcriptional regulator
MTNLGFVDLEILFLGIDKNGNFNEIDIENSNLKRLGVGKILDSLASLKDQKLIDLNKDGSFSITSDAKHILWDKKIPLWVNILRVLEIKSFSSEEISKFLKKTEQEIFDEVENLRKNQLVLMSPHRIDSKIIKIFEILPEGREKLKIVEKEGLEKHGLEK